MDWRSGRRHDKFRYALVGRSSGKEIADLDMFEKGGTLDFSEFTSIKVSGKIPFVRPPDIGFDYLRVYSISTLGAQTEEYLHGTFLVSTPSHVIKGKTRAGNASVYSLLQVAADAAPKTILTVPAGTNAIAYASDIIRNLGLSVVADRSTATLNTNATFDAGTPWLEIINRMCEIAGFDSADVDPLGNVRLFVYVDPALRSPTVEFIDDERCTYNESVDYDFDIFSVPNVVIITMNNEEETLIAIAENRNPMSIYSTVSRGREIVYHEEVTDVDGQDALQVLANRRLAELTSAVESRTLTHNFVPFSMGDVIHYVYAEAGDDFTGAAVTQTRTLTDGIPCKTRIRNFVRG